MASGIAVVTTTVKMQSGGDSTKRTHQMVLSGLQRCPEGLLYLSKTSVNLKSMGVSCIYGVWLHHISCVSTATSPLFVYASGATRTNRTSASFKIREGDTAYFCPTCATQGYYLVNSAKGIAVQFSILGK